ncbi:AraC family transcriptional regulator [Pseudomonas sp. IT-P12]|uniref:AraC family transcriptional regulator n=1 Tax=Pseudomonas sp. IT-P12 TaxID=3026450 RepID=UPI0039E1D60A
MKSDTCATPINVLSTATGPLKPWQERKAKRLMLDHLDTGISVTQLADACALSRSHFTRKFRQSTQMPPTQWLRQQRIRRSKQLLQSSTMLLTQIALECGFCDHSHFCRIFSQAEGMTPLTWQRRMLAEA